MLGIPGVIELGSLVEKIAEEQSTWSQAAFGADSERGPLGALRHLELEAAECIQSPTDIMEYADCFLLILDASRRAGFHYTDLLRAAEQKLEICKSRAWPRPNGDFPVEHVR